MTKHTVDELGFLIVGAATGVSADLIILKGVGVFIAGILGALGSWVFTQLIKPKLTKLVDKLKKKQEKAQ